MLCTNHWNVLDITLDTTMFSAEEKKKMRIGFAKANMEYLIGNGGCEICNVGQNANGMAMIDAVQNLLRKISSHTLTPKPQISERKRKHLEAF